MINIARVNQVDAVSIGRFKDSTVFQSDAWLKFVSISQSAEPVVAHIYSGPRLVGRFSGLLARKAGLRILGSPMPGWTTAYMGFNLEPDIPRVEVLRALRAWAFNELGCAHIELMDRHSTEADVAEAGLHYSLLRGFEVNLAQTESEIFSKMKSACRRCVRKAERCGVVVDSVTSHDFVDDFYLQLQEVFSRQALSPTYTKSRVKDLISCLVPTGNLLLLRAKGPDGSCIATGIFPALNDTMYFWGGASLKGQQEWRPNELIQWAAMRYWKQRGITKYDMGGGGDYKRKYGGQPIAIPWARVSKYPAVESLRNAAKYAFSTHQRVTHRLKRITNGMTNV